MRIVKPLRVNNDEEKRRDVNSQKPETSGALNNIQPKLTSKNVTTIDNSSLNDGNSLP